MNDKSKNTKKSPAFIIMKRELQAYFTSPTAYIVTGLFVLICGIIFFATFFLQNSADLRAFFALLPMLLSFFVPALTMRLFSEESKSGSMETLMTLPVNEVHVVTGKYLASFLSTLIMISPSIFYVITTAIFGDPDVGPIIGGYIGTIFLCAGFTAVGVFASSVTKNQIIAFFTGFIICIALTMIDTFLVFLPSNIVEFVSYISADMHFRSITQGIIDSRDLVYFITVFALFFTATIKVQQNAKK